MDKRNIIILLDNGHGIEKEGKRSPDGRLREYKYCRSMAAAIEAQLLARGCNARRIVEEETDVPLTERCRRVNDVCHVHGKSNVLLVSLHCNAAGDGSRWMAARGWQAHVSLNASRDSKRLARCLIEAAELFGQKVRKYSPVEPWWPQDLAMCRDTLCPAVLTENLFQDNREDVAYMLSDEGRQALVDLHVKGITDYIDGL